MTSTPTPTTPSSAAAQTPELAAPLALQGSWIPSPWLAASLCFFMSLAMHLPWLAITPIAGTEGHRIFPARTMARTGHWLVPMLFDKPFMTKPPLHHWLIALSQVLSGKENVFFWRLPSAITGAALCAAVCGFGGRWFGKTAGLISGLCAVGMVAIWGQSQVADIDSTNTLAAVLTALCGIELFIAPRTSRWPWIVAASLALTAIWMTKGPAGLTIVAGVWIWAAAVAIREKRLRDLFSPAFWLPFVAAVAVFRVWWFLAETELTRIGMPLDLRGIKEATHLGIPKTLRAYLEPLFVMLPELVAFALPVSASLAFFFNRDLREKIEPSARRVATALVAAVLISWAICTLSGMFNPLWVNPRYYYPTLLPLCPLAGLVAVTAVKTRRTADWLRGIAMVSAIGFAGAAVGLTIAAWKLADLRIVLIVATLLALIVATWTVPRLHRSWNGAWGLVLLILLASVPFGAQRRWSRATRDSGVPTAARLQQIVGRGSVVAVEGLATSKPETLDSADVRINYLQGNFVPENVEIGQWVVLDQAERKQWLKGLNIRIKSEQWLCRNGQTDYYVGKYAGKCQWWELFWPWD